MNHQLLVSSIVCAALLSACNSTNFGKDILNQGIASVTPAPMGQTQAGTDSGLATGSTEPITYKNNDRKFSITIPAGWSQQGGDVNSDSVQFMEVPLSKSCSFQISMTRMQPDFPAKASVKASLASAKKDIQIDKLLSAERRDESGLENGKKVKFTRGWQVVEKGQAGGHQRIIYQAYDRQNYYMNLMAAALTEHFEECRPNLEKIIDSIKFGD